jgi:hypothetical protein
MSHCTRLIMNMINQALGGHRPHNTQPNMATPRDQGILIHILRALLPGVHGLFDEKREVIRIAAIKPCS